MNTFKPNLKNYSLSELENLVKELNLERYRAEQIYNAIYVNRITDFEQISSFSKELRNQFCNSFILNDTSIFRKSQSKDGSIKFLFKLKDGKFIEAVYMPWLTEEDELERITLCISSQAGCPIGCKFCATGTMGLLRNLETSEILDQILLVEKEMGQKLNNIVLMGMGEPLMNFENVTRAINILTDEKTQLFSRKKITISTSGIAPKIIELAKEPRPVKLAISLHATTDKSRQTIIPINKTHTITKLMDAVEFYYKTTRIPVTYEYIPLLGINDTPEDAKRLAKIAKRVPSRINLIPFNDISFTGVGGLSSELKATPKDKVIEFAEQVRQNGAAVIIRDTFGDDIEAACGQLALSEK